MSPLAASFVVFICLFGAVLLGMSIRMALPEHHLTDESKHVLEVGLGIIGTMAGLVLGLLVASATGSYNAQRSELIDVSSKVVVLDRLLAHYGPETNVPRETLRVAVARTLNRLWPSEGLTQVDPRAAGGEALYDEIAELSPKSDVQTAIKPAALGLATTIGSARWLMYEQQSSSVSVPLLVVLVFWFSVTFLGFGLFAPRNATVIAALALCAVSVSGAIFILLEMYTPFEGLIQLSSAPLRDALAHLGK
jgi:hypothetical protein